MSGKQSSLPFEMFDIFPGKVTLRWLVEEKHRMSKREGSLGIISSIYPIVLVEEMEAQRGGRDLPKSQQPAKISEFSFPHSKSTKSFLPLPVSLCLLPH